MTLADAALVASTRMQSAGVKEKTLQLPETAEVCWQFLEWLMDVRECQRSPGVMSVRTSAGMLKEMG